MLQIAIIGYGNTGKAARAAIHDAPDMNLAGIVRRAPQPVEGERVVTDIAELGKVDAAILCVPTVEMPAVAKDCLLRGISTVDSFDMHAQIGKTRAMLDTAAKQGGAVAILSAGWDPGSDSVIRALLMACAPRGVTYTNFGPGLSMGHSVAVRAVPGVKDGISVTIPLGQSIHRRMVYVMVEDGARFEDVAAAIKADPYFVHDETHVVQVDDIDSLRNAAHGVYLTRNGVSGDAHNQQFEFTMRINNPALTSQVMVGCARAAMRQKPGCYTMIELPMVDLLPGEREKWVNTLV